MESNPPPPANRWTKVVLSRGGFVCKGPGAPRVLYTWGFEGYFLGLLFWEYSGVLAQALSAEAFFPLR